MAIIDLEPPARPAPLWRRLSWMMLIWAGSIMALGVVAMAIRIALRA